MTPGQRLRTLRARLRMTQNELSVKAKVGLGTIGFAERDARNPNPIQREAIARALRVESSEIWPDEEAS